MQSRRWLIFSLLLLLVGCTAQPSLPGKVSIGLVGFEENNRPIQQYDDLKTYLGSELGSVIELEPTYNERQALAQIQRKAWDIVFASPGLAAIAISQANYTPILPLEGGLNNRSVFVVRQDSPLTDLRQLNGSVVALGQVGSATGYYLPLYNLYGLTLAEVRLAATPKLALEWVATGEVAASAMSLAEYSRYRPSFSDVRFRVLFNDSHDVPSGAILLSDRLNAQQQQKILQVLQAASPAIAASAGYIANVPVPDYTYLIEVVERVSPLSERVNQKPAPLY